LCLASNGLTLAIHPVVEWHEKSLRFIEKNLAHSKTDPFIANGSLAAYLTFAYDLYVIEHNGRLDHQLVDRLKLVDQFQGARHEIFAEATCIRAGFTILMRENISDTSRKHAEFVAMHKKTGQVLAVEAKSRHASNQRAATRPHLQRSRLGKLINAAAKKDPALPLAIFLDVSLAPEKDTYLAAKDGLPSDRLVAFLDRLKKDGKDLWNVLSLTTHPNPYSEPQTGIPSITVISESPRTKVYQPESTRELLQAVGLYGNVPQQFPRQ
jgi:hypothetical protein